MLNTFSALAQFGGDNDNAAEKNSGAAENQQTDSNAAVDISAVVNRLNEMETKLNQLLNRETDFPARGKNDTESNTADTADTVDTGSEGNDNAG